MIIIGHNSLDNYRNTMIIKEESKRPLFFLRNNKKNIISIIRYQEMINLFLEKDDFFSKFFIFFPLEKNEFITSKDIMALSKIESALNNKFLDQFISTCKKLIEKYNREYNYSLLIRNSKQECEKIITYLRKILKSDLIKNNSNNMTDNINTILFYLSRNFKCFKLFGKANYFTEQKREVFNFFEKNKHSNIFYGKIKQKHCIVIFRKKDKIKLKEDFIKNLYKQFMVSIIIENSEYSIEEIAKFFLFFLFSNILNT